MYFENKTYLSKYAKMLVLGNPAIPKVQYIKCSLDHRSPKLKIYKSHIAVQPVATVGLGSELDIELDARVRLS